MLFSVVSLYGCSTKAIVPSNPTVLVAPPDSLLIHPCKASPAGISMLELAQGYKDNVECVGLYKAQIEKIRKNKQEKLLIHSNKGSKEPPNEPR